MISTKAGMNQISKRWIKSQSGRASYRMLSFAYVGVVAVIRNISVWFFIRLLWQYRRMRFPLQICIDQTVFVCLGVSNLATKIDNGERLFPCTSKSMMWDNTNQKSDQQWMPTFLWCNRVSEKFRNHHLEEFISQLGFSAILWWCYISQTLIYLSNTNLGTMSTWLQTQNIAVKIKAI